MSTTGSYLATFDRGTREPHPFTLRREAEHQDSQDERALRVARGWAGFSELFRRTDTGYVRVGP